MSVLRFWKSVSVSVCSVSIICLYFWCGSLLTEKRRHFFLELCKLLLQLGYSFLIWLLYLLKVNNVIVDHQIHVNLILSFHSIDFAIVISLHCIESLLMLYLQSSLQLFFCILWDIIHTRSHDLIVILNLLIILPLLLLLLSPNPSRLSFRKLLNI